MGLFGHGESLETLPKTLQAEMLSSLIDGTDGRWEKRAEGRKYSLVRYTDCLDGYMRDNRELSVSISPYKAFGGEYFQAVRIIKNPVLGEKVCFLERRVDLFDGQYYWSQVNMNHTRGVEEGNAGLQYLFDEVLDPYLGFMQIPASYAQRLVFN